MRIQIDKYIKNKLPYGDHLIWLETLSQVIHKWWGSFIPQGKIGTLEEKKILQNIFEIAYGYAIN